MKLFDLISGIEFLFLFCLTVFAAYFLRSFHLADTVHNLNGTVQNFWLLLPDYAVALMLRLFSFSFILSLLLIVFVIWTANNLIKTRRKMHDALNPSAGSEVETKGNRSSEPMVKNEKWERVIVHINSANPSDWKLAILECDIMLGEILEKMGYLQESIGEKLKSIEPSDFTNIEAAWEAHKIRNEIAHEGSDFAINEREAKRVIGLYELVFREFEYI